MAAKSQKIFSIKGDVSKEEWRLRCDLAACYRIIARMGWDDLIFTHFSMRLPGDEKAFLINPFGVVFEQITASNLVKIDVHGKPLQPTPYPVNPAGFVLHSTIHEAREDAHCILHLHTPEGVAVSCQSQGLLPISQSALSVYSETGYHDYAGIVFDENERGRLLPSLGANNCLILRNHGLLTCGETIPQAFMRMYFLQRACQSQIMAQAGGGDLAPLSKDVIDHVHGQTEQVRGLITDLSWQAVLDRVEASDPDYKT